MKNDIEYSITPRHKLSLGISELLEYKELVYIFTWREIKVKYKQTVIGILWVVLQPLLMMLIISAFLSHVFQNNAGSVPYYLYVYSGLISWNLFSAAANTSVNNILSNANIIKKIYFPRMIIPLSSVLAAWIDFVISFVVLMVFMLVEDYKMLMGINIFYVGMSVVIILFFSLALGLYFSALVIKYRDFRYALPFLIQLLFFLSPVIYTIRLPYPVLQKILLYGNPMIVGMDLMRKGLFGKIIGISGWDFILSVFILCVYLLIGIYAFRKTEEYIADKI